MSISQSRQRSTQLNNHQRRYSASDWSDAEDDSGSETTGDFDDEDGDDASDSPELDQYNEDLGLTVSDTDSEVNYRIDDENPTLMSYLKSEEDYDGQEGSSDAHDYSDLGDHSDDSSIEREEEQHIQDDLDDDTSDEMSRIRGPLRLSSSDDTESGNAEDEAELDHAGGNGVDHDEDDSEENDFFDDFFDPVATPRSQRMYSAADSPTKASEDDSYLWQYFFSSGDDEAEEDDSGKDEHLYDTSMHDGHVQNTHGAGQDSAKREHSGDSTDEEAGLPESTRRAQSNRATEVLGVNTYSTRPPVLGEWDIDNSQGTVGIIDGLTTRTLSPPLQGSFNTNNDRRIYDQNLHSDSDMSDLALDEFIKTDELSDDDGTGDISTTLSTPHMYRSRFNKNVPLSAFRNRSSPYPVVGFDGRRNRRRSFGAREVVISPVRQPPRRMKKLKNSLRHRGDLENLATKDLIEELVDIGAISPLFEL